MKTPIEKFAFVAIFALQLGCAQEIQSHQFTSDSEYEDLSGLFDENYISIDQISQMQESDDELMDIEDQKELMIKKDKILIVGDSWASFPCVYNSMGKMIRDRDPDLQEDNRCLRTTKLGVTASDWESTKQHRRVIKFLKNTPRLKYLYVSLGGNDLMRSWNKDFTPPQETQVIQETITIIKRILDQYVAVRPDIKIILSGYDYPNFTPKHKIKLYREIFERMGSPSPERLNPALVALCQYMARLGDGKNIFYIQHLGLAHYYDGNEDKGLAPMKTLSPDKISPFLNPSVVGGAVHLPTSKKSMINWLFIIRDAFHFNTRMYRKVMWHTYDNLLVHILPSSNKQLLTADPK